MDEFPTHWSILTFDIEGFSDPHRDDCDRLQVRSAFYDILQQSFASAGVSWNYCRYEDRGDGALILVPPSVSKVILLDPMLACICAALAQHNRTAPLGEQFRLRFAVHAGEVAGDEHGLTGTDIITACRMLDAWELRASLFTSPGQVAMIVSNSIYEGIVRHGYGNINPSTYHPVSVQVKKSMIHAWIHLPIAPSFPAHPIPRCQLP